MKLLSATIASLSMMMSSLVHAQQSTTATRSGADSPLLGDVRRLAPALEKYSQGALFGDVWKRPGLSPRDRSVVTLAALIARNQTIEMGYYLNVALDNGVKPREISEIITHLAFYAGWPNAFSALPVAKDVFEKRPRQ